ncbi:MAG: altronate dehydratase family protein [Eubacteriales bacterium]|nr:altronate dehydratase family protein [Eubacteriales bacterium]
MVPSNPDSGLPAGWLRIHPADHVAVVLNEGFGVPPGHKVALTALKAGQRIVKYGWPIGVASEPIEAGAWVHTHNLSSGLTGDFSDPAPIPSPDLKPEDVLPASGLAFSGYRRPDGRVGTRNELWVIPTVGCVNQLAAHLAEYGKSQIASGRWTGLDGIQAWTHPYGCSQLGDDHVNTVRLLSALAVHPNAGAVLVVGLGCENNQVDDLRAQLGGFDASRIRFMVAQEEQDEEERGRAILDELARFAGRDVRVSCPLADLVVGLKCGGSDAYSGLTANPLLGRFTDRLVRQGGSALLTEIPECFGAEQVLLARTPDPKVRQDFIRLIRDFRQYYTCQGFPVGENPSPGNKAGGITTLEEKSLGCVQKAGQAPLVSVIRYGERQRTRGLTLLEAPGNDLVAVTALAAAGAQLILFTTGRGNPLGGPVPTLKIASNSHLARQKPHWIDLDAGPALSGDGAWEALDAQLLDLVVRTASGTSPTCSERAGYREIAIFKNGVTL